jgi:hypothetical protein
LQCNSSVAWVDEEGGEARDRVILSTIRPEQHSKGVKGLYRHADAAQNTNLAKLVLLEIGNKVTVHRI